MMVRMLVQNNLLLDKRQCLHCDTPLIPEITRDFCCHGCETAYNFIKKMHLGDYYRLLKDKKSKRLNKKENQQYEYLDHPEFQKKFCESIDDRKLQAHLFLGNLDCYACVWVCEKAVTQAFPDAHIIVNMAEQKAQVTFNPHTHKLCEIASLLDNLGYPTSPNQNFRDNSKSQILKIGVGFFCLMNIMLLSSADYLSDDLEGTVFYSLFRYISMALASLALIYPGLPFYQNTFRALKKGHIHLDIPISLALISSYLYSSYNTIQNSGPVYFDSMVAIICLLLLGRYVQSKSLQKHFRKLSVESRQTKLVRVMQSDSADIFKESAMLQTGDKIRVLPGGVVPVKSILNSAKASIRLDFFTGEDDDRTLYRGDEVQAGSLNQGSPMELECIESGTQSILFQIESAAEGLLENKGRSLVISEKIANFLVLFILCVSAGIFAFHYPNLDVAIARSVTTLLIACPCAFGLGAPLIIARALQLGLTNGLIFRNQKGIEVLPEVKNFFFDKTGTLTQPAKVASLVTIDENKGSIKQLASIVANLSQYSDHHIPKAMQSWSKTIVSTYPREVLGEFVENFGQGLTFKYKQDRIRIGRASFCRDDLSKKSDHTYVAINGKIWAVFSLEECLKDGAEPLISALQARNCSIAILSGDQQSKVKNLRSLLHLPQQSQDSNLSPEQKLESLSAIEEPTAMVGNGINDALALAQSTISIAVHGSSEYAKKFSDIVLIRDDLTSIKRGIEIALDCSNAFRRSFGFALVFNIIGITLGALGYITPIVAALLMPISSLTVIYLSTHWGNQ